MSKTLALVGCLVLATSGFAQQTIRAQPVPGRLKEAGVYHVGTRTWTHARETLTPSQVIYRNDANTGFFGVMAAPVDLIWTDEGCIPGNAHEAGAQNGAQRVRSIQLKYCSSIVGPQVGGLVFYDSYTSCTDPLGLPIAGGFGFALPGGSCAGCWIVTFDLTGSTFAFDLTDDSDGVFDGTTALDNFGWTLFLADGGSGGFNGPFLDGDPNNFPYGDGTYYQDSSSTYGTGLGTRDQFWVSDPTATYANGCYWFGGYASGAPFASFSLVLGGKSSGGGGLGTTYCVANSNSAGAPADISGSGSASSSAGNLTLTSAPVPNQNSIFFHAANQAQVPFGCSYLCATGNIVRGAIALAAGNVATYTYDNSDTKHSLGGFVGAARNFQHWFRDPMGAGMCGGQTFNTSNAITITILP